MARNNRQVGGFAGWAIRLLKQGRANAASRQADKQMECIETLSLGGRKQVAMIACCGQRFLVGFSGDAVTSLLAIPGSTSRSEAAPVAEQSSAPRLVRRFEGGL